MIEQLKLPEWSPVVRDGMRILVAGATGGIGSALVEMLSSASNCIIGAHGVTGRVKLSGVSIHPLQANLQSSDDCESLVSDFCELAGGIDALVVLVGAVSACKSSEDLSPDDWSDDINLNLNIPFYLAQAAMRRMTAQGVGGRILLTGTESALHGGGPLSLPYGVAKRGTECLVEGLARDGAPHQILVNGLRLGFVRSGFHQRWQGKTNKDLLKRAALVPLGRGADPKEAAALSAFLLSDWAQFMTGSMISLSGGDWL